MKDKLNNEQENVTKSLQARADKLAAAMRVSENLPVSTIASWKAQIDVLSTLASSAGISIDISSLVAQLASVESEVSVEKAKAVIDLYNWDNKELLAADSAGVEKIDGFHQQGLRLNSNHQEFMVNASKYIEKKEKETKELTAISDLINEKNLKGEDIDPNILKPLIKTPEQIKEEIKERRKLEQHKKEVTEHHKAVHAHEKELKEEQAKLEQDLSAPKQNSQNPEPVKQDNEKTNKLKLCASKIKALLPIIQKVDKQKEQVDTQVQKILEEDKRQEQVLADLMTKATQIKRESLKQEILSDCESILNQEKTINNESSKDDRTKSGPNKEITDSEKKAITTIADIADQMRSKLTPVEGSRTTNSTNKVADSTPPRKNLGVVKAPSIN